MGVDVAEDVLVVVTEELAVVEIVLVPVEICVDVSVDVAEDVAEELAVVETVDVTVFDADVV